MGAENAGHLPRSSYKAYLDESRSPLACLVFCLPILVAYHVGVWLIQTPSGVPWANGADVMIGLALERLGLGGPMVSFFLIAAFFLFWHQSTRTPWRVRVSTLWLMLLESLLFAIPPFLLGKLLAHILLASGPLQPALWMQIVLSLGAGVYEEFLFRVVLMGLLFWFFKRVLHWEGVRLYVAPILLQAVLFSLFHHLPGSGEPFAFNPFAFRTICGVYFAYLYQERGFAIAAGSHAVYDLITVMLNEVLRG